MYRERVPDPVSAQVTFLTQRGGGGAGNEVDQATACPEDLWICLGAQPGWMSLEGRR